MTSLHEPSLGLHDLSVDAADVAAAIVKGVADGSDLVWVPAALRGVMSGLRHVPRALFRKLPL